MAVSIIVCYCSAAMYQQLKTNALIRHLPGTVILLQAVEQIQIIFVCTPCIFIAYYLYQQNTHIFIDVYLCLLSFYYSYAHITCANNK